MNYLLPRKYVLSKRVNGSAPLYIGTYDTHEACEQVRKENAAFHYERCPKDKLFYIVNPI